VGADTGEEEGEEEGEKDPKEDDMGDAGDAGDAVRSDLVVSEEVAGERPSNGRTSVGEAEGAVLDSEREERGEGEERGAALPRGRRRTSAATRSMEILKR
jgi:hypothetical protein